jgi:hypothetical protein
MDLKLTPLLIQAIFSASTKVSAVVRTLDLYLYTHRVRILCIFLAGSYPHLDASDHTFVLLQIN